MLSKKTVFILGAGASKPYGFPTAIELSNEVILNSSQLIKSIMRKYEQTEQIIKDDENIFGQGFLDKFKKAHNSHPISIDEFLSKENNFSFYGLQLMIHYLMMCERESRKQQKSDWIELLIDKVSKGVSFLVKDREIDKNFSKIKIITFNYERSFEHLLFKCLINKSYSENNVKHFLRLFSENIIHIYGSIGKILDSVSEKNIKSGFCQYGYCADDYELYRIIENIKIMYDERREFELKIKDFIKDAEQIFFLGFGFDEFNIANLYLNSIENPNVKIYGTVKGKAQHADKIKRMILEQNDKLANLVLEDVDCNSLIDNYL